MNTRYINYILTIAKRKNMTKAAEELYVSQSSLSQYLTKLEQELGTALFYRTKWELVPTPAGELYIEACKQIMEIKEKLYQQIKELDNAGNIAVGVTSQFGLRMMTEIVPKFKEEYPNYNITISKGNLLLVKKMLQEETVDVAIVADTEISPAFKNTSDILRQEEVLFAIPCTNEYVATHKGDKITVEDVKNHFAHTDFLQSKQGSSLHKVFEKLFDKTGFTPQILLRTNSVPTVNYMIASGAGVSLIAESCCRETEKIKHYAFDPPVYRLNIAIRRANWLMHQPEQRFYDMILKYFKIHTEHPYLA